MQEGGSMEQEIILQILRNRLDSEIVQAYNKKTNAVNIKLDNSDINEICNLIGSK